MLLCTKIKLEVSLEDAKALEFMQAKCRALYNWWVMRLRDGEKWPGVYEGRCGHLQAMPLYKRTYACTECGLVLDRDENSAVNILARYLARRGPHTGDPVRCADVFTATDYV